VARWSGSCNGHGNTTEHIHTVEGQRVWQGGQQVAMAMATRWSTYLLLKMRGCGEVVSEQQWLWQHDGARTCYLRSEGAARWSASSNSCGNMTEHILAVEDQRVR